MKIGLLSDTHGYLDPTLLRYFENVDEIWHAGDIGSEEVITTLASAKPVKAVFGNIDDRALQNRFPEDLHFFCDGLRIFITHIAGTPPRYNARIKKVLAEVKPDILICGHSHILRIMKDLENKLLFINPGAAGQQGFHHMKTIVRFEIIHKEIKHLEVIELGKRGAIV